MAEALNRITTTVLPRLPRALVWRFSARYIAGPKLIDALARVGELNRRGLSATIDVLGEDVVDPEQVYQSVALYERAAAALAADGLDCGLSVKLSELGLRIDSDLCARSVERIVEVAGEHGRFVRIDMEDASATDRTLAMYRDLRTRHGHVGAVIQSCLRRSRDDIAGLLDEGIGHVRLCKGIYIEPAHIAFQDRDEVSASFRECLDLLLTRDCENVGIATHDPDLLAYALRAIEKHQVPRSRYEFQMLLGVAERMRGDLVAHGHPVRVYVPFGEHWHAYSMRRLRENPQIARHVISNLFKRA